MMSSKIVSKPLLEAFKNIKENEVDDQDKVVQKCAFSQIGAFMIQVSKAASLK